MSPTTPIISVERLTLGYDGASILDDVSLQIRAGEFIGIVGPNGAGKSTFFKGLLGLVKPMKGSVRYSPGLKGRIGYVPQRDQLDPIYPLTVWDVVQMGLEGSLPWYQPIKRIHRDRIRAALEQVGMMDQARECFPHLSGGQRQRVLIARALVIAPQLLVLDEPTAGIDVQAEKTILGLLETLNRKASLTILMVSHHLASLKKHASRVVWVDRGRIRVSTPEEIQ